MAFVGIGSEEIVVAAIVVPGVIVPMIKPVALCRKDDRSIAAVYLRRVANGCCVFDSSTFLVEGEKP